MEDNIFETNAFKITVNDTSFINAIKLSRVFWGVAAKQQEILNPNADIDGFNQKAIESVLSKSINQIFSTAASLLSNEELENAILACVNGYVELGSEARVPLTDKASILKFFGKKENREYYYTFLFFMFKNACTPFFYGLLNAVKQIIPASDMKTSSQENEQVENS